MSKAVRIREHLYDEIERLAKEERRSLISQLEILLEQALKMGAGLAERGLASGDDRAPSGTQSREPRSASPDPHFKPDPK